MLNNRTLSQLSRLNSEKNERELQHSNNREIFLSTSTLSSRLCASFTAAKQQVCCCCERNMYEHRHEYERRLFALRKSLEESLSWVSWSETALPTTTIDSCALYVVFVVKMRVRDVEMNFHLRIYSHTWRVRYVMCDVAGREKRWCERCGGNKYPIDKGDVGCFAQTHNT